MVRDGLAVGDITAGSYRPDDGASMEIPPSTRCDKSRGHRDRGTVIVGRYAVDNDTDKLRHDGNINIVLVEEILQVRMG